MHGRIKTKTTEQQERIKKQEREKKLTTYKNAMRILMEKRKSACYDEKAMDIMSSILIGNPDIITVWNYRREILLHLKVELSSVNFQAILEKDLSLTEQCLRVNPKSYGSWHHRIWVMCNIPAPNWEKELLLCKRYLELDERNFHCWDYRRTVTQISKVPDLFEYEYTLEMINKNFSNYSAWHLRSKLLPRIFPDMENNLPINEEKHKEELELVQNAAFTDPNDQSAWFYQRWLLGLAEPKIHFVSLQITQNQIIVAVSQSISQNTCAKCGAFIKVEINGNEIMGPWKNTSGKPHGTVWILELESQLMETDAVMMSLVEDKNENDFVHMNPFSILQKKPNFFTAFGDSLKEVITNELTSCKQLLDLEPDSKWTYLTCIQLMKSIDAVHYEKEIYNGLKKLIEIDPLRRGYYEDLASKLNIESTIGQFFRSNNVNILSKLSQLTFGINGKNLTCLYHMQYLVLLEDIDLSCNSLTSEALFSLHCLLNCKRLNLDNNNIKTLKFLPHLPLLNFLSLYNNNIEESVTEHLEKFKNLKEVYL